MHPHTNEMKSNILFRNGSQAFRSVSDASRSVSEMFLSVSDVFWRVSERFGSVSESFIFIFYFLPSFGVDPVSSRSCKLPKLIEFGQNQ